MVWRKVIYSVLMNFTSQVESDCYVYILKDQTKISMIDKYLIINITVKKIKVIDYSNLERRNITFIEIFF